MPEPLNRETILSTAEDVLRRFGPAKTTVVDVARALDVSHGSVYRHFPSKAALRDAVTERWLARLSTGLDGPVLASGPAGERLRAWVHALAASKQGMAREDPELFATFRLLTDDAREVVAAHVDHLAEQVSAIVADGVARGEFRAADPVVAGRAVFQGTGLFHHPAHAEEWGDPHVTQRLDAVLDLLLDGLSA